METKISPTLIYDLSNDHFKNAEIELKNNQVLRGQFVKFKVKGGMGECVYPAEKFCFLPKEDAEEFWIEFKRNKGTFSEFPSSIIELGLHEIARITIEPLLIA